MYLPAAVEGVVINDCCPVDITCVERFVDCCAVNGTCVERFVDCCAVEGISVERFVDAVSLVDTCLKAVVTSLLIEI